MLRIDPPRLLYISIVFLYLYLYLCIYLGEGPEEADAAAEQEGRVGGEGRTPRQRGRTGPRGRTYFFNKIISVSDPDPRILYRDDGSGSGYGSGSDLKSSKFQFFSSSFFLYKV